MIDEMHTIEFEYNTKITKIGVYSQDSLQSAVNKFIEKENLDSKLLEFSFNNKEINLDEKVEKLINDLNDDDQNILIQVKLKNNDNNINQKEIYEIKCPKCSEPCRIKIENYLIKLYQCKNGHRIENIELDEFTKIQNQILMRKCKVCNQDKPIQELYRCINCKIDLCKDCKTDHGKNHEILDYNQKKFICESHKNPYSNYCFTCKLNICLNCLEEHYNHVIITFSEITPNIDDIKTKMNSFKNSINLLDEHIKELMNYLYKIMDNMKIYYNIYENILNNYDSQNKNYEILKNLNEINDDNIVEEINHIINYETKRKAYNILNIYNKMKEYNNEITINYKLNEKLKNQKSNKNNNKKVIEEEIFLFGPAFVENNKNICKIIFKEELFDLTQKFKINYNNLDSDFLEIKLKGIQKIQKMEQMFKECSSLLSVPDIDKWDISKFTDLHGLFFGCSSLVSLPDLTIWNTENIKDFSHLFSGCSSLISLPDLSKWNSENVNNLSGMFTDCKSLIT